MGPLLPMTAIKEKIRDALNETRILILGTEVLVGFQFRAAFEKGFEASPPLLQHLGLGGLTLTLLATAVLIAPAAYHRIVARGEDTPGLLRFATKSAELALLPLAATLGLDLFLSAARVKTLAVAAAIGLCGLAVALFFWYGMEVAQATKRLPGEELRQEPTKLEDKIDHVLVEVRMILPGVQALLGFQFIIFFGEAFDRIPQLSREIHLVSLLLVALSTVLLMTPAAYHRIVEHGEDTERFHRVANRLVLAATLPLALGMAGDFYVVTEKITHSPSVALAAALALLIFFLGLWFGVTLWLRWMGGQSRIR